MNTLSIVTVIMMALFAGLYVWAIFSAIRRDRRIRSWPTSSGQVLESWITDNPTDSGRRYNVRVEYQYKVSGDSYVGSAWVMYPDSDDQKQAEYAFGEYPVGRELDICYNPRRPDESKIADLLGIPHDLRVILISVFVIAVFIFVAYLAITGPVECCSADGW